MISAYPGILCGSPVLSVNSSNPLPSSFRFSRNSKKALFTATAFGLSVRTSNSTTRLRHFQSNERTETRKHMAHQVFTTSRVLR